MNQSRAVAKGHSEVNELMYSSLCISS